MNLITYLQSLMQGSVIPERIKLLPKDTMQDNTRVEKTPEVTETEYKTSDKGLIAAFPKEMNWLNWENKGFRNALLDAQIWTESRGNPNAVGPMTKYGVKAVGMAQFMPGTWEGMKKRGWISKDAKRTDPQASVKAQKEYMNWLYDRPDIKSSITPEDRYARTLASYNAGYGNLKKAISKASTQGGYWLDYMSNETRNYVSQIRDKTEEEYFKNKEDYVSKYQRD